jgi:hypothetical protein
MPLGAFKAALMGTAGVSTETVVLLHDTDYSNAASADITSGIDSTYGEYIFKFYNINPATDGTNFTFQVNAAGESGFNETMTTTDFRGHHKEDDSSASLVYDDKDQAQGTAYQLLAHSTGNGSDESCSGTLHLFNPSSTTYVKHFYTRTSNMSNAPAAQDWHIAGYINTTTAIDEISFKMSSGNFDGTIKMWGVK